MPITNHDILWYQVNGAMCIVHTCFPHAETCCFSVDQPIAPNPQYSFLLIQMIANHPQLTSKQLCFIATSTTGAFVIANVKNFIHPSVKGIGFKHITNFIHYFKNNFVQVWMQRAITFAVQSISIWPNIFLRHYYTRCFVKLRIYPQ